MVVRRILPAFLVVTAFAFVAQLAFVLVILLVTGDALGRQFRFIDRPSINGMAGIALGLGVFVLQEVFRLAIMVKGAGLPIFRRMASFALRAIAPLVAFVIVLLAVAGDTLQIKFQLGVRA